MTGCFLYLSRGDGDVTARVLADLHRECAAHGHLLCHVERDLALAAERGWCPLPGSPVAPVAPSDHEPIALNRAVAAVPEADAYVWVHSDMVFYPDWFADLLDCLEAHPEVGIAAPYLWPNPEPPQQIEDEFPDDYWQVGRVGVDQEEVVQYRELHAEHWSPGGYHPWCFRRSTWEKLGGFDEQFQFYGGYTDVDFHYRMYRDAGQVAATFHRSVVWHRGMGDRRRPEIHKPAALALNKNRFKLKHGIVLDRDISLAPRPVEDYRSVPEGRRL